MPATKPKSPRVGCIATIHVLKTKLGLPEDTYRALLMDLTGKSSSAKLDMRQLQRVVDKMRELERDTGQAAPPPTPLRGWMPFEKDDEPKVRKIKALWIELGKLGRVDRTTIEALNAWVKRQTGIDHVAWLDGKKQAALIEQLKEWTSRPD